MYLIYLFIYLFNCLFIFIYLFIFFTTVSTKKESWFKKSKGKNRPNRSFGNKIRDGKKEHVSTAYSFRISLNGKVQKYLNYFSVVTFTLRLTFTGYCEKKNVTACSRLRTNSTRK